MTARGDNGTADQEAAAGAGARGVWEEVARRVGERGGGNLDMWFQSIQGVTLEGRRVVIRVPNQFTAGWVRDRYGQKIVREMRRITSRTYELVVECAPGETPRTAARPRPARAAQGPAAAGEAGRARAEKPAGGGRQDGGRPGAGGRGPEGSERLTFDSFVEGDGNRLALSVARMVADDPGSAPSPLYMHGGTGMGKTHLLCAIQNALRARGAHRGVIYVSAESFMNQFIENIGSRSMREFRDSYRRDCTTLLIDDIQFLSSKQKTQEELFHCFNELHRRGKTVVIAADRPPSGLDRIDEGLRSRFGGGLVVDIRPPDAGTRQEIVERKAARLGIALTGDMAQAVARQPVSSVRELEGILLRLQVQARLRKEPVSDELLREVIGSYAPQGRAAGRGALDDVVRRVAEAYGLKVTELKGTRRSRTVALPRQVAMYICRDALRMSYPDIASRFGGKNHSTVISACRKIEELSARDQSVHHTIRRLRGQLGLVEPPPDARTGSG